MPVQPPVVEPFSEGSKFRALRVALEDPRGILTKIGALVMKESQRAFREQRLGSARWKSRGETGMNPNWPAIIADFAAGKASPPDRRFADSPALVDTGMLKKSVVFRLVGRDSVEIGSNLAYADALHAGRETKTKTITQQVQTRLWEWIKRAKKSAQGKAKRYGKLSRTKGADPAKVAKARDSYDRASRAAGGATALGWLLNPRLRGQQLTVKHPARPIVGLPASLVTEIENEVGVIVRQA